MCTHLYVIGKIDTEAKLIGPDPQNETVPVGGMATFQCKVKSKVKPHIRVRNSFCMTGSVLS